MVKLQELVLNNVRLGLLASALPRRRDQSAEIDSSGIPGISQGTWKSSYLYRLMCTTSSILRLLGGYFVVCQHKRADKLYIQAH